VGETLNDKNESKQNHITMQNRKTLEVTGVDNVDSFDETVVVLLIGNSVLTIDGENLHIVKLNVDKGEVLIEGLISSLFYSDGEAKRESGVLSRIFKGR